VLFRQAFFARIALIFFCLTLSVWAEEPETPESEIRITSYNVENYLTMPRRIDGKFRPNVGKPESEKSAVTRMIALVHPDVLGLEEIGDPSQLEDVRRRLRKAGMEYPYSEYLSGSDTTRHIALLSRFPIIERHSHSDLPLWVNGVTLHSPRGILDVTVEPTPGYRLRILCVHLKAKLEVAEYDEVALRVAEAKEVRRIVRDILRSGPDTRLILMGDFNDTKNEQSLWQITGKPDWPDSLQPAALTDDRGEYWTEYWGAADVYSRIDYILTAKKLEQEIDTAHSGIARPAFWNEASDHCPATLSLKLPHPQ
jgi:endonuclease/exonuclease/phosphatase family metal-dependent hydrolase